MVEQSDTPEFPSEAFVYENNTFHRVASTRYSEDETAADTFCHVEVPTEGPDEYIFVPLDLLDKTRICWDCERNHRGIQDDRFPSPTEYEGEYKFAVRAELRLGEYRGGYCELEMIPADTLDQAKERFEELYENAEVYQYHRISRSEEGDWETLVDNRSYKD